MLDSMLPQTTQKSPELIMEGREFDVVQDVAADLEVFIQLAKVGHYDRAMPFFNGYLEHHSMLFPVATEYADCLLEQNAFGQAEDFLSKVLKSGTILRLERTVLELLSALASMHTSLDHDKSIKLAFEFLTSCGPLVPLYSDEMLQATVLCFRIYHEATKDRIPRVADLFESQLPYRLKTLVPGNFEDSRLFKKIAASGQVWLAEKLLESWPPGADGTGDRKLWWDEAKLLQDLMPSIQAIPGGDSPPAILARIGLLANYCQQHLADPVILRLIPKGPLPEMMERYFLSLQQGTSRELLSTIDTNIEDTRQFKHAYYAIECLQNGSVHAKAIVGRDRRDYAMTALAQVNLARFWKLDALDLNSAWLLFRENRDKLGWLRLLALVQRLSKTARQSVSEWDACEWGDRALVGRIESELMNLGSTAHWS